MRFQRDPEGTDMSGFRMGLDPNIRFAIGSDTNISEAEKWQKTQQWKLPPREW